MLRLLRTLKVFVCPIDEIKKEKDKNLNDLNEYGQEVLNTAYKSSQIKEVILYISEDGGENWDKGVRFVVEKGKEPNVSKFTPNSW